MTIRQSSLGVWLRLGRALVAIALGLASRTAVGQGTEAEIKAALTLIKTWQLSHSSYHLRIETTGAFVRTVANLYCIPGPAPVGRIWKLDNHLFEPNEARCIFEATTSDIVAYFPETRDHVNSRLLPADADLLAPGLVGLPIEDQALQPTKVCTLRTIGDLQELKMVYDPRKLRLNPTKADITIFLRFDSTGRIHEVEQQRLGLRQISTLNYLEFDQAKVTAVMPVTPDPTQASGAKTFEQALQDSILFFRRQKQG